MASVLLTGATGALGPAMVLALLETQQVDCISALLRAGKETAEAKYSQLLAAIGSQAGSEHRLRHVVGDVRQPEMGLSGAESRELLHAVDVIVHAAADTRFRCPPAEQRSVNVDGTQHVLRWAANCRALRRVVLVSTNCVAGRRTGEVAENVEPLAPEFVNPYEQSKWEAEQRAVRSGLPVTIVRLSTCAGSEADGKLHRLGGLHYGLRWMMQGLVPMVPGDPQCRVDLISNELAAGVVARAAVRDAPRQPFVCQVSAGESAPRLGELIGFLADSFRRMHEGWRRGQITPPAIVGYETFAAFQRTVAVTGDVLFQQVIDSVEAFLPALLYPKRHRTENADLLWGDRLPQEDWRRLVQQTLCCCANNARRLN